jgi:hypothetical protein
MTFLITVASLAASLIALIAFAHAKPDRVVNGDSSTVAGKCDPDKFCAALDAALQSVNDKEKSFRANFCSTPDDCIKGQPETEKTKAAWNNFKASLDSLSNQLALLQSNIDACRIPWSVEGDQGELAELKDSDYPTFPNFQLSKLATIYKDLKDLRIKQGETGGECFGKSAPPNSPPWIGDCGDEEGTIKEGFNGCWHEKYGPKGPLPTLRCRVVVSYCKGKTMTKEKDTAPGESEADGIRQLKAALGVGKTKICCDKLAQGRGTKKPCDPSMDLDCDNVPNQDDDFPWDGNCSSWRASCADSYKKKN